jgi:hypothetical protein
MADEHGWVRIADLPEAGADAGRLGQVFGRSIPSSSGVGPVIGSRFGGSASQDLAYAVVFEGVDGARSFAPHLVEAADPPADL